MIADSLNYDFLAYNRDLSHEIPQKRSHLPPLGAICLSEPPLTWNPASTPDMHYIKRHDIAEILHYKNPIRVGLVQNKRSTSTPYNLGYDRRFP
jgi:hypothetical protein